MNKLFGINSDKDIIESIKLRNPYKGNLQDAIKDNNFDAARLLVRNSFIYEKSNNF